MTGRRVPEPPRRPEELSDLFLQRANAGDVEAVVALYEPDAVLAFPRGRLAVGHEQIRAVYAEFLASRPALGSAGRASPAQPLERGCLSVLPVTGSGDGFNGGRSGWHGYLSFGCHGRRESCQEHHIESTLQVKSAPASHGAQLLAGPRAAAAPVINLPPAAPSTRQPARGPARDAGPGTAKIWRRRPR